MSSGGTIMAATAIVCLIDASLTLASEWEVVWTGYILTIVRRLYDAATHSPTKAKHPFYIGFVAYATADARPSPLVACRYFDLPQTIAGDLKEIPPQFGFGASISGGQRGMAALEGYAAALELFDQLREDEDTPKSLESYLIHVAAHPPDETKRPSWNTTAGLDDLSWDTLPKEMHKRKINLNMILLKSMQEFSQIHNKVTAGPSQPPWFPLKRNMHAILLSGMPMPPPAPAASPTALKRPADAPVHSETSPDAKRARTISTGTVGSHPATQEITEGSSGLPEVQPAASMRPAVLSAIVVNGLTYDAFKNRMTAAAVNIAQEKKALEAQISDSTAADATAKLADIQRRFGLFQTASKQCMFSYLNSAKELQEKGQVSPADLQAYVQEIRHFAAVCSVAMTLPQQPSKALPNPTPAPLSTELNGAPATAAQPLAQSSIHPAPPPQVTPHMAAQMAKLLATRQPVLPSATQNAPAVQPSRGYEWRGVFNWAGHDSSTNMMSQVSCGVVLASKDDLHVTSWPRVLQIAPSRYQEVPVQILKAWTERTNPIMCSVSATDQGADLGVNATQLKSLSGLLASRHIYAVASWTRAGGVTSENLLLMPGAGGNGLFALAFPLTGLPEFPSPPMSSQTSAIPQTTPAPMQPPLSQASTPGQNTSPLAPPRQTTPGDMLAAMARNNPALAERFKSLPRDQQQKLLMGLYQQQIRLAQQGQANSIASNNNTVPTLNPPFGGAISNSSPNMQGVPAIFNQHQMANQQQQQQNMNAVLGGQVGMGNVSFEVMQSFMQRNQNGAGQRG